jgi:tripartite-type tricarboxylate transporter receptor subunit TctC
MNVIKNFLCALAFGLIACSALAQDPGPPVRVLLPFGAGSGTDNIARPLFDALTRELNQPFVIDNRPGANGFIAAEAAAHAAPDGKTLLFTTNTTHSVNPNLFKKLPYDPVKDFKPVSTLATSPYLLLVRKEIPVSNVGELKAWILANQATASYAWGAAVSQMAGAGFLRRLGVKAIGVPYKSSPQAVTDLIGGQVGFMFLDLAAAAPIISGGRVKALAVTAPKRVSLLPNVPTMAESGMSDFYVAAWTGVYAPAGTPDAVIARLSAAIRKVSESPELQKKYENCCTMMVLGPDDFADYVRKDRALWAERAAAAGIVPE